MIEIRCGRCGRRLTNERSRARKFGPVCFKKRFPKYMRKLLEVFG